MILKNGRKLVSVFQPGNNPTTQQREQSQFQLQAHGFLPSLQYSMDEKNDKQGGAFRRKSEIYQRSGQKRHLGEFLFTRGAAVLQKFSL